MWNVGETQNRTNDHYIGNIDIQFLDLALFTNFIDFQDNDLDNI